jgi:hypothetical protein
VYTTILSNVQSSHAAKLVPAAAEAAGLDPSASAALLAALPLGAAALAKVPGITNEIIAAAGAAFQQSYVHGVRTTALASLSFGVVAIIGMLLVRFESTRLTQLLACCFCNDIGPKMSDKIEIYLENDENAGKNKYH